jgi:ADP-heptose:LPS heptosyltransferase
VREIKTQRGECEITVFVNKLWAELIRHNPNVKEVRESDDWLRDWTEVMKAVIAGGFDEVMIPNQLSQQDNMWHQYPESREQNLFDFYLKRCRLDNTIAERRIELFSTQEAKESALQKVLVKEPLWFFHTTSRGVTKDLPINYWDEIIKAFPDKTFAQLGLPNDAKPAKQTNVLDFTGMGLSLLECYELIKAHGQRFIGIDSGMSFIACAANVPCYIFYGSSIPMTSGPFGPNVKTLVSPPCRMAQSRNGIRCHGMNCGCKPSCIELFRVEDIIRRLRDE